MSGEPGWIDLSQFAVARNLTATAAAELRRVSGIVSVETGGASFGFSDQDWQALARGIAGTLAAHHQKIPDSPGIEPHRLRQALVPRLPADGFAAAIAIIVQDQSIRCDGRWLELAGHTPQVTPSNQRLCGGFRDCIGAGRKLAIAILEFLDRNGITMRDGDGRKVRAEQHTSFVGLRSAVRSDRSPAPCLAPAKQR